MANLHILLADGDDMFRANAQRALTRQGYFVLLAASSQEAVTLIEQEPLDVVVTDVELLSPDDIELVRKVQKRPAALPVLLTADPRMVAAAANGVRRGAVDYILKPVDDFTRLASMIERAACADSNVQAPVARAGELEASDTVTGRFLTAAVLGQDLPQLFTLYAVELAKLAHAQVLALLVQDNGQLQLVAAHGYVDRAEATRAFGQHGTEDFAWQVIQARDLLWRSDLSGKTEQSDGVQDMLGLPLLYAGHLLGVTLVQTLQPRSQVSASRLETIKRLSQHATLVAEMARVRDLAERRNPADRVTGLLVRSHFFELADREFRRSWRFGEPIGALEVDVDDFSKIQLLLGPSGGDDVMQQIARSVRPRLRSIDIVGRIDTDKLGVLVLMASRDTLMVVAERLRRAIAEIEVATEQGTWQVTASIGVASYPREQCASVHDLFALAAQATRAAKRAGRNRVVSV